MNTAVPVCLVASSRELYVGHGDAVRDGSAQLEELFVRVPVRSLEDQFSRSFCDPFSTERNPELNDLDLMHISKDLLMDVPDELLPLHVVL